MTAPVVVKSKPEAEREGVKAIYRELRGCEYKAVAADHQAWTALKKVATVAEIETRWRAGLSVAEGKWNRVNTIWQLGQKWNDLAPNVARVPTDAGYDCGKCSKRVEGGFWACGWRAWVCGECFGAYFVSDAALSATLPIPCPQVPR